MDFIKKKPKNKKLYFVVMTIVTIILLFASVYSLYAISLLSGIENVIRFFVSLIITIILGIAIFKGSNIIKKFKFKKFIVYTIVVLSYSFILIVTSYLVDRTFGRLSGLTSAHITYSASLVTLNDNTVNSIGEIDTGDIGMLSDKNSVDGYQIPKEIIKSKKITNKIVYYDSYIELLKALYNGTVNYAMLPTNYALLFDNIEGYEDLESKTKVIFTLDKKVKSTVGISSKITKPFTVLIMGVDSEKENIANSSFNGDALMLITFNPKTLNTTILSIPRDTYVPIACFTGKRQNKITHAAWYGQDCMIKTIENFTGIKIDYYVKINFKGVVAMVDNLGGIEVDVPYNFCEQNSNRLWGKNTVFVEKGLHTLTGEQALALARNRHPNYNECNSKWTDYESNDFIRGQNQQLIIKALLNKAKGIRSLDTINSLLDTISNNLETNMTTSEILSLYNVGKSIINAGGNVDTDSLLGMQRLYLSGYDKYIYDYSMISKQGTKLLLYNFVPYQGSITDIVKAMKINLGLIPDEPIKVFSFSITVPYKETIIGKNDYSEKGIALMPNFFGKKETEVINWGEKNNIKVNVNYITSTNSSFYVGMIVNQNAHENIDIKYISTGGLTIDVIESIASNATDGLDCSLEENISDNYCQIPDFIGQTKTDVTEWFSIRQLDTKINFTMIAKTDTSYDATKTGKITKQSTVAGVSSFDVDNFNVEYME